MRRWSNARAVPRAAKRNAIAIVALVFAMTGTGMAASRYVITSKSQIKPSVRRELRDEAARAAATKLAASGAHAVRARVRTTGPLTTSNSEVSDPVTGGTWTQTPEEVNFGFAQLVLYAPSSEQCSDGPGTGFPGTLVVKILVDGKTFGSEVASANSEIQTIEQPLNGNLFEPGKSTPHTMSLQVSDSCGLNGGRAKEHFRVESVAIDVVGVK